MAFSRNLQAKLDYYEQVYNSLDEPIPFKEDLKCYPVVVKDYYKFYNSFGCITMDKNVKTAQDEMGRIIKVSNPQGIGQSYLEYLIEQMRDENRGKYITAELMELLELVFHIPKGAYCSNCGKTFTYEELFKGMDAYVEEEKKKAQHLFEEGIKAQEGFVETEGFSYELPQDILAQVIYKAQLEYYVQAFICPECQGEMHDTFAVSNQKEAPMLKIKGVEINPGEFDELKAIIPRQNILDYEGDKYLDPELKEELEIKAKLQNKDYTSPTLEKQLVCVGIATGYTLEYLKTITMRKLSMMLRLVDRKETYYAQLQGMMSGMVSFKEDPKHWIFSEDKKNIKDELTSIDDFEKKFSQVT